MEPISETASSASEAPVAWRRALSLYDRIFLPRVKARWVATRGATMHELVRARLLIVLVVYQFAGVLLFSLTATGHSAFSWSIRGVTMSCFFLLAVAVRFVESPNRVSQLMVVLLFCNTWVLLWVGAGADTLTASNAQLMPLIYAVLGGTKVGLFGTIQALAYIIVIWVLDAGNYYNFPARIEDNKRIEYFGTRAVYLTLFATVLALNYAFVHTSKVRELKRMNVQLGRAAKEAQEAADMKSTFIATMSHEIRTPLNGIIGMAQVLSHSNLDREQRAELQMLQDCGESLLAIINDILDVAKIQANKVELEAAPVNLSEIVDKTFSMVSPKANENKVHLSHDLLGIQRLIEVVGDPLRIQQILINVVGNAVKFTPPRGEVSLRATCEPSITARTGDVEGAEYHRVSFAVTDTGVGIPPERMRDIFDAFTQTDPSVSRQHGGTGLGLTICRSLARMMGGDVVVTSSTVGAGSTFTVHVRLRAVDRSRSSKPVTNPSPAPLNKKVLYLDCVPTHSASVARYLDALACPTTLVRDARSAMDAVKTPNSFDWVVINLDTFDVNTDMAALSFALYIKELDSKNPARRIRLLLLRNPWFDPAAASAAATEGTSTATAAEHAESTAKLRALLQTYYVDGSVVVLNKPVLFGTLAERMGNPHATPPTPVAYAPPTRQGSHTAIGRNSSNSSQDALLRKSPPGPASPSKVHRLPAIASAGEERADTKGARAGTGTHSRGGSDSAAGSRPAGGAGDGPLISPSSGGGSLGFAGPMATPDEAQLKSPTLGVQDVDLLYSSYYSDDEEEGGGAGSRRHSGSSIPMRTHSRGSSAHPSRRESFAGGAPPAHLGLGGVAAGASGGHAAHLNGGGGKDPRNDSSAALLGDDTDDEVGPLETRGATGGLKREPASGVNSGRAASGSATGDSGLKDSGSEFPLLRKV